MLTLVLLGAGGWYCVNNQLEPFTADSLRYGDRMGYVITEEVPPSENALGCLQPYDDPPNYQNPAVLQGESTASVPKARAWS